MCMNGGQFCQPAHDETQYRPTNPWNPYPWYNGRGPDSGWVTVESSELLNNQSAAPALSPLRSAVSAPQRKARQTANPLRHSIRLNKLPTELLAPRCRRMSDTAVANRLIVRYCAMVDALMPRLPAKELALLLELTAGLPLTTRPEDIWPVVERAGLASGDRFTLSLAAKIRAMSWCEQLALLDGLERYHGADGSVALKLLASGLSPK